MIGEMWISAKKHQFIVDLEGTAKEKTAEKTERIMLIMDMSRGSKIYMCIATVFYGCLKIKVLYWYRWFHDEEPLTFQKRKMFFIF